MTLVSLLDPKIISEAFLPSVFTTTFTAFLLRNRLLLLYFNNIYDLTDSST